jgi:alkyl hydroperoxide reductase subunit F
MATFFTPDVAAQIRERLTGLDRPVRLLHFTQPFACGGCAEQKQLLEELTALSPKLTLELRDLLSPDAARLAIDKVPATLVLAGDDDFGIRFYGRPGGYEFISLLDTILMVSTGESGLDPAIEALAASITVPTHLEVMVTLTCPYCPKMVHLGHQLAFVNPNVRADMVDASEFPDLVQRYGVHGVPRTVINGRPAFEGALPAAKAVMDILQEVDPAAYEAADAAIRELRGERLTTEASPDTIYDVIVVGAGPAGMSAALYAVRKNRQVALIGRKAGGQITDTATVENYLGVTNIGGRELAELFRHHLETYPVAERCHTGVSTIRRAGDQFEVATDDGHVYRGRTVIYAAGSQYRRLGVPGEERFIGRGIGFCATCDAPLYRDKAVAVVGGGNSALTAVHDLAPFAREIHLVHHGDRLRADEALVARVREMAKVTIHLNAEIREFLGQAALAGVRVASVDGRERYDLAVEGVFLEIGLTPNSDAVRDLVPLNQMGEIPVSRDQSSAVAGLFAAGDVTDERDKQIVIAAGAGARAALAADRYLAALERGAAVSLAETRA